MINELNIVYIIDLNNKIKCNTGCFERDLEALTVDEYESGMYDYECK